ncbi:MAG TPA: helix-turn-helix domain-containing protein [bacterium]|nr:helix-turn-helix domain-containing protein [bacterium]
MKHHNTHYLQLSRKIFIPNDKTKPHYSYEELPMYSRWIFAVLKELEQQFTGTNKGHSKDQDFFYRSNEELAVDCGLSVDTIKRYKKPLIKLGFVQTWQMHWRVKETGKLSEKKVCAYRILI